MEDLVKHEEVLSMLGQTERIASDAELWSHQAGLLARNALEALREIEYQRVIIAALLAACERAYDALSELLGAEYDVADDMKLLRTAIRKARGE